MLDPAVACRRLDAKPDGPCSLPKSGRKCKTDSDLPMQMPEGCLCLAECASPLPPFLFFFLPFPPGESLLFSVSLLSLSEFFSGNGLSLSHLFILLSLASPLCSSLVYLLLFVVSRPSFLHFLTLSPSTDPVLSRPLLSLLSSCRLNECTWMSLPAASKRLYLNVPTLRQVDTAVPKRCTWMCVSLGLWQDDAAVPTRLYLDVPSLRTIDAAVRA